MIRGGIIGPVELHTDLAGITDLLGYMVQFMSR